ncbi:MAG TPA: DUF87 domain-containing protein, partial [Syntrophomonadaceae bacterium]|nr:DUF87 domain-containing protein [Syntrophomonadaceae bacterium]
HFFLNDISKKISSSIGAFFTSIDKNNADAIADSLLQEALHIAGLSIIKATGADKHVREFIANTLVRKLLTKEPNCFCDAIFSLDAFLHWFDNPNDRKRPDLLRIKATIEDGYFNIEAQIIECKLAQQSEGYIQKAREQIENGLHQLIMKFQPRNQARKATNSVSPDQRYWWLQLHRLIASKGNVNMSQYEDALLALERLSEGFYNITWQAAVVAIWIDSENDDCHSEAMWNYEWENNELDICVAQIGKGFLPKACLEDQTAEIFVSNKKIKLGYDWIFETIEDEGIDTEDKDSPEIKINDENTGELEQEDNEALVEVPTYPDRILLGVVAGTKRNIYWEFGHENLINRHLLIFGASGTGKTYAIQALMYELSKYKQNSLVVDYTNGFTTNQLEPVIREALKPQQYIVRREPLPINPFRQQAQTIEGFEMLEDPASTAQRVSGVFAGIYQLGDQQKAALYTAIREGVAKSGEKFNFTALMQNLDIIADNGGPAATSANSVKTKIQPFIDTNPFGVEDPQSWDRLFSDQDTSCHIIQLAGFMKDFAHLITDFALIDLYRFYRALGDKAKPRVIILDEIQNLDHKEDSPLAQFLREGRKFGISLILATQTLSNLARDERDRLFQASHKLFFKPADTEIRFFAGLLADATGDKIEEWISRLAALKRGECYSLGSALNERTGVLEPNRWFKIKISELNERFDR